MNGNHPGIAIPGGNLLARDFRMIYHVFFIGSNTAFALRN